jgi:YHS domain-containing protein
MRFVLPITLVLLIACEEKKQPASADLQDPVCGMAVKPADSKGSREANGLKFGFCSDACLKKYDQDPKKYAWGYCDCAETMKHCKCGHCQGKPERCDCK